MSTSKTKKNIIEYLWEWAEEQGNWAKLLVQKVVDKELPLTEDEIDSVYKSYLQSLGLIKKEDLEIINKPKFETEEKILKLISLSQIEGVNKLAPDQTIIFSNNLTIIYGGNATGKTGYSRVLKSIGQCYEKNVMVLPNIYGKKTKIQSAQIEFNIDSINKKITWNGTDKKQNKLLSTISTFTNDCVKISLGKERELLVTPIGFHLFSIISDELNNLNDLNNNEIDKYGTEFIWMDKLNEGTRAYNFISNLSKNSKLSELLAIARYDKKDQISLKTLKGKLARLNKELIETEIRNYKLQKNEISQIIRKIVENENTLNKLKWDSFKNDHLSLENLNKKERIGLNDLAQKYNIQLYTSNEFQRFIKSADDYIKLLNKPNYPNDSNEICIYCQQKLLDNKSRILLKNYRILLNDTTQDEIRKVTRRINDFKNVIKNLSPNLSFHQPIYGEDEEDNPVQPQYLKIYNKQLNSLIKIATKENLKEIVSSDYTLDSSKTKAHLKSKENDINEILLTKEESLARLDEKEESITNKINELLDSKLLNEKVKEVRQAITNYSIIAKLQNNSSLFSTNKISRKTSDARNELIAKNFNAIFVSELKALQRTDLVVNLEFKTEKGISKLKQNMESHYNLSDILSEGEQKSIALAEYLTELQLDNNKSPIIFDDPVTSLDHNIIDSVANRLITLSFDRQVIIFTHSILLLNSIRQKLESLKYKDTDCNIYETTKDSYNTGILIKSYRLKEESFSFYKSTINEILNTPLKQRNNHSAKLAIEGYNKLRAAIEILVEKDVFQEIIKRYRKNIALPVIERIDLDKIKKYREEIYSIYERCCNYTDAHSDPDIIENYPNLDELKIDFNRICEIRKEFV